MNQEYDYEYFSNRKPFKRAMERVCDFSYYTTMDGSPSSFFGDYTINYHFAYDMEKFLNNLSELKQILRRTKMYRCLEETRKMVESIPDDWRDFESYFKIANLMWELIDLSKSNGTSSQCYHYDVVNDVRQNLEFQSHFYKKMARPMISLIESNGWEKETWRWWIDVPQDKNKLDKLVALQERFVQLGEVSQKIGKTLYKVDLIAKEFDSIPFASERCTYMRAHNYVSGRIDIDAIDRLIGLDNDNLFESIYKGGIVTIFAK